MTKTTFFSDELNIQITVVYNPKLKRINFRFKPQEFYISAAKKLTLKMIEKYIEKYKDYILKYCCNQSSLKEQILHLWGKPYNLVFVKSPRNSYLISEDTIYIYYTNENNIKKNIRNLYKNELSKKDINNIFNNIITKFTDCNIKSCYLSNNYKYCKSFLGRFYQKTKEIELSSFIAKYDESLIYHTLCHELCHFYYFNHSKEFKKLLLKVDPYYSKNKQELKKINKEIVKDYI